MGPLADFREPKGQQKQQTLKWLDKAQKDGQLKNLINDTDLLKKKEVSKVKEHHEKTKDDIVKSLRDKKLTMSQITGIKNYEKIHMQAD